MKKNRHEKPKASRHVLQECLYLHDITRGKTWGFVNKESCQKQMLLIIIGRML